MSTWWPVVQAQLVAVFPTLTSASGFTIHDGPPAKDRGSHHWIAVGHSDSDNTGGALTLSDSTTTAMRGETGEVVCEIVSWSGDDELSAHRAATFAVLADLDALIRQDPRLGVLPACSTTELSAVPVPGRDGTGTAHRLLVTVHYTALS